METKKQTNTNLKRTRKQELLHEINPFSNNRRTIDYCTRWECGANEVQEVTTEGQVEFRPAGAEDGELEVLPPETGPDAPDVEIDPEVPVTTGPLSIMKAATMNFGTQVISNQDQTYNMVAEMARLANPEADGPTHVPYVSFAQVQDLRGTNAG